MAGQNYKRVTFKGPAERKRFPCWTNKLKNIAQRCEQWNKSTPWLPERAHQMTAEQRALKTNPGNRTA